MASHKRPADEAADIGLPPIGPVASTGYLAPTPGESSRAQHQGLSPSPSQVSLQPATPSARSDVGPTEYFPPLRDAPSFQQGSRPTSSSGFPGFSGVYDEPPTPGSRRPSIRIRRRGSSTSSRPNSIAEQNNFLRSLADSGNRSTSHRNDDFSGRPRSISQPERTHMAPESSHLGRASRRAPQISMPRLTEEGARPTMEELGLHQDEPLSPVRSLPEQNLSRQRTSPEMPSQGPMLRRMRAVSRLFKPGKRQDGQDTSDVEAANAPPPPSRRGNRNSRVDDEYDELLVDYLDTIDPEIQTLSTLTNVQNSLFIPDLGSWVNRRPTYNLSRNDIDPRLPRPVTATEPPGILPGERIEPTDMAEDQGPPQLDRSNTISSRLTDSHYAALPHGASLEGWTEDEKWELDDHVRHMLHSRRSRFKRSMKGFGQYVRRPLGFLVTLYATLITLFGLAWVLFLIGWIYVGDKQLYVIHIIDSVLVALFAVMGDGLAPFRAIDTYHMIYIVHYARIVKKAQAKGRPKPKRKWWWQKSEPKEQPQDAAPDPTTAQLPEVTSPETVDSRDSDSKSEQDPHTRRNNIVDVDVEDARSGIEVYEDTPLTYAQQQKLYHHQTKLAKSHSFYKPNETNTHYAFPIDYLIAIVILLDCHSCLQISLGACTWGIDYHVRPIALTTVILCVSITCNITAGLIITIGDRKTRKKEVWKLMNRQELTGDAMKHIEQKRTTGQLSPEKSTGSDSDKEPLSQKAKRFVSLIVEEPEKEKEMEKEAEKPKENGGSKQPRRVA
ncbi:unnamed protein product [Clonostachys rhizophaga]|uniref:Integral membrane protein n=1 Tax=Clonostachys rhizophaga TaxID=160324 RepID=A0A9N9V1M1_9HYPO|nr:unnamed protein product [Clonostachys rhizophaga]